MSSRKSQISVCNIITASLEERNFILNYSTDTAMYNIDVTVITT